MSQKQDYNAQYATLAPRFLSFLDAEEDRIRAQMARFRVSEDDEVVAADEGRGVLSRIRNLRTGAVSADDKNSPGDHPSSIPQNSSQHVDAETPAEIQQKGPDKSPQIAAGEKKGKVSQDSQTRKSSPLMWIQEPTTAADDEPQAPTTATSALSDAESKAKNVVKIKEEGSAEPQTSRRASITNDGAAANAPAAEPEDAGDLGRAENKLEVDPDVKGLF